MLSESSRRLFDNKEWWSNASATVDIEKAPSESYDCVVVLSCLASAVESLSGEPIDLMMGALEKSGKDVQRGVR